MESNNVYRDRLDLLIKMMNASPAGFPDLIGPMLEVLAKPVDGGEVDAHDDPYFYALDCLYSMSDDYTDEIELSLMAIEKLLGVIDRLAQVAKPVSSILNQPNVGVRREPEAVSRGLASAAPDPDEVIRNSEHASNTNLNSPEARARRAEIQQMTAEQRDERFKNLEVELRVIRDRWANRNGLHVGDLKPLRLQDVYQWATILNTWGNALKRKCPACGAIGGEPCFTSSGLPSTRPHTARSRS